LKTESIEKLEARINDLEQRLSASGELWQFQNWRNKQATLTVKLFGE